MPRRQPRDKHLTKTRSGTRARIRINGHLHDRHFRTGTDPQIIKEWVLNLEMKRRRGTARTGKFNDDADFYLAAVKGMKTFDQREQHINDWVKVFGDEYRSRITPDQIAAQLAVWKTNAANKRRTALMHLYSVLDGKAERNPVRDVPRLQESAPAPRAIPYATIRKMFKVMPTSRSKAHLMTVAYTGLPPGMVAQLTPANFDQASETLSIPGRKKGAGTIGRVLPLTPDAVRALKLMSKLDAWGSVSRTVLRRVLQRAEKAAQDDEHYLPRFTPYDLRHAFGTEVYRRSGDIRATQVLMGHSSPTLTHRYTLAAVEPRVKAALKGFGR